MRFGYILLIAIIVMLIAMPNASALFDSKAVDYNRESFGYPTIVHKDILGRTVQEFKLSEHTSECLVDCVSELTIDLKYDGELVEAVRFLKGTGKSASIPYSIKYETTEEYYEDIPVFEDRCEMREITKNGTSKGSEINEMKEVCEQVLVRYDKELKTRTVWKDYQLGKTMKKGVYLSLIHI